MTLECDIGVFLMSFTMQLTLMFLDECHAFLSNTNITCRAMSCQYTAFLVGVGIISLVIHYFCVIYSLL